ncbi:MAG TPA: gliding motility protein GldN [Chitinophagaceae bacterium]|jgi:gliding motility associated protien GldN|nr:gliding motility protein GldN [Chitinophagaceae bacterium]
MKHTFIKSCFLFLLLAVASTDADAQRRARNRGNTGGGTTQPAGGGTQPAETQQTNDTRQPSGYNPYGNIPIIVDSASMGGGDSVLKKSLRNDAAFDKSFVNERTPLPYEHLRWDDALFAEKVWREIDLREKMNQSFRYKAEDDNGDQQFISILLKAVKSGEVTAFSDDRFTTPVTGAEFQQQISGGPADTVAQRDVNDPDKIVAWVVTQKSFDVGSVMKLRIKEEWVFDREASRLFVRILGIAPLKTLYLPNGQERGTTPMFWVYYPDLRPTLAKYEVYNPKNMGMGRMTWEELFESRMFSSYITKSTLDNPNNRLVRQMIKDPILALLEGENIKERIFNYEQDLWSY